MEAIECITTRRSVRRYSDKPVTDEVLKSIVDAARFAPSWRNSQTVSYIAVRDPSLKQQIAEQGTLGHANNTKIISMASVVVVVVSKKGISGYEPDGSFTTPNGTHWTSFDAGIATEAFCLAAHNYGVGSVILGIIDSAKIAHLLGLSDDVQVSTLVPLGYPSKAHFAPPRKEVSELLSIR